jgi:serine/threonine-protein kinase
VTQPAVLHLEEKHRILAHLGQGGTSDVYLAVAQGPIGFNKLVVLKILKKSLQSDRDFRDMFLIEARLAARLNHPNIVQTYEVIDDGVVATMVMEYLEGSPLSSVMKRAKDNELSPSLTLRVIADALAGLHYAHELNDFDGTPLGVVHRDFTPQNIFVTFEGQVKVLDFGIAKLSVSSVETRTGMVKGKIRYIPPEQILGRPVDRRSDIYSAGVMLWQAATGVPLWKDQADAAVMMKVAYGELPSPESIRPDVHPALARVCKKALAFNPEERHSTAAELEAEIEEVIREIGEPVSSRDVGRLASGLFEDVRQSTKMLIEQQLSSSVSSSWQQVRLPQITVSEETSDRRDSRAATEIAALKPQFLRDRRVMAGTAAVLAVWVLYLLFSKKEPAPAPEPTAKAMAATPAPQQAAPLPPQGKLRVSARPSDAQIWLDGKLLPANPAEQTLPLDRSTHDVRVEAKGYLSRVEQVVLDRDTNLELTLEREPSEERARARTFERPRAPAVAPARRNASAPSPAAAPASNPPANVASGSSGPNCEKPFFIDERGIKRMLPECL